MPEATGGDGTLTYSLSPVVPAGLSFDADARTLSGTPKCAPAAGEYTYTATDEDGDKAELKFKIRVASTLTVGGVVDIDLEENAVYVGSATLTGTPVGIVDWELSGDDGALFKLENPSNSGVTVRLRKTLGLRVADGCRHEQRLRVQVECQRR